MVSRTSGSELSAPNYNHEPLLDEYLSRGFFLTLGAGGCKEKSLHTCEESIRMLFDFARNPGFPGLATTDRTHLRP